MGWRQAVDVSHKDHYLLALINEWLQLLSDRLYLELNQICGKDVDANDVDNLTEGGEHFGVGKS